MTVKIRFSDFQSITRARTLTRPVADEAELRRISFDLAGGELPDPRGVRLLGVTVSHAHHDGPPDDQLELFKD